ncbi:hypothetical protein A6A08_18855 [Nocardiopsis sp. TSRI0078]|uniref:DinB family protein n=1 Tax=unclassified Nocardiopsis TaxID=2649073 RepID=UPI00093CBAA2|nr:DinB family protein [Nocardiopsis sp. TSRI0078]OKI23033.1 hypothetical protein A6A08_18855 [Nocardiopsis sp. TSRI0078]
MSISYGRADVFVPLEEDPREGRARPVGERAVLVEFLRCQRLTLELKCAGLDAGALARRSVPPSTMSLLGLVRHMAEVERLWFWRRLGGRGPREAPSLYVSAAEPDGDFDGAVADPAVVEEAWSAWRAQCAHTDAFVSGAADLEGPARTDPHSGRVLDLREVLVHMVEEYARHNGHADLLRERADGRVGQ